MEDIKFDHLGSFAYSPEEGTPSINFPDQVDEDIKQERIKRVMKAQQRISYQQNKKHIGQIMEGLVIGKENNSYLLRSYWNAPDDVDGKIYVKSDKELKLGEKIKIKITDAFVYDLMGELYE